MVYDRKPKDAELVARICRKWSIPYIISHQETKGRIASGGCQNVQYRLLEEVAAEQERPGSPGHQADDQSGTMMMRFINGGTGRNGGDPSGPGQVYSAFN